MTFVVVLNILIVIVSSTKPETSKRILDVIKRILDIIQINSVFKNIYHHLHNLKCRCRSFLDGNNFMDNNPNLWSRIYDFHLCQAAAELCYYMIFVWLWFLFSFWHTVSPDCDHDRPLQGVSFLIRTSVSTLCVITEQLGYRSLLKWWQAALKPTIIRLRVSWSFICDTKLLALRPAPLLV